MADLMKLDQYKGFGEYVPQDRPYPPIPAPVEGSMPDDVRALDSEVGPRIPMPSIPTTPREVFAALPGMPQGGGASASPGDIARENKVLSRGAMTSYGARGAVNTPGIANAGVAPTATPPASSVNGPFTDYASTNPTSMYDRDIEFTHTLSRMLGMAGLGEKAMGARDLHMKLQAQRVQDVGTNAQKSWLAGDITAGINMMNHMVPNGVQITGYRKNKDGTIALRMQDGSEVNRSPEEVTNALAAFSKPELIGTMMTKRAQSLAELGKEEYIARLKGNISLQQALMTKAVDHEYQKAIEEFKAKFGKTNIEFSPDMQRIFAASPDGSVIELIKGEPLPGSKMPRLVPGPQIIPATTAGGQAQAPSVDQERIAKKTGLTTNSRYPK
jgi:hypothetical protein